ncbi:MAG: hypothetical protein Q4F66_10010, partial [Clostridium sp.]|nr:hypothetical protein [Clostridium sp.]
ISYLGDIEEVTSEQIKDAMTLLANSKKQRVTMQQDNIKAINGDGVKEVARYIISKIKSCKG